jgi:L-gulono-1,4-lactone dehydrogenase
MKLEPHLVRTYGGTLDFRPGRYIACRSVEDVQSAVLAAASAGMRIRTFGAGYSWAPELKTDGACLDLSGLNRIRSIDPAQKTISVDAGARLGDISRALAIHGLALPSLSFLPEVTIGGAVATGTHGTSPKWGILADFVKSMQVVLASGEVKVFGPESPPQELQAARVAVGMLGAVVRVELQAVDMPRVRFSEIHLDLATFRLQLASILEKYEHVWAHWTLGEDKVRIECLELDAAQAAGSHNYVDHFNAVWRPSNRLAVRVLNGIGFSTASLLLIRERCLSLVSRDKRRRDHQSAQGRQLFLSMQYGLKLGQCDTAIDCIRASEFALSNPGKIVEFKFVKGEDRSLLGPNTEGDAVLFNLWWFVDEARKHEVFTQFEETMQALHAKPHWGKLHSVPTKAYMRAAYPKWEMFEAVRQKYDPKCLFSIFAR